MKHKLLSTILSFSVCAGLTAACHPTSYAPLDSGIDFKLSTHTEDGSPLRPDGLFHVEGIDRPVSVYVPAAPLELDAALQRLELPPGSYTVSYLPTALESELDSLRGRHPVKVLSQNPFVVVVSEGQFAQVKVRTLEAAAGEPVILAGGRSAHRR